MSCAKTAEPIEMPFGMWTRVGPRNQFGMWTRVGPRNHVLDGGAHWRHLANTICTSD